MIYQRLATGLGLLAAGLVLGVGAGAVKWRGSAASFHREARMQAIFDHASQMPAGGVLVIGDSITEYNRFERLCDRPALNAGIAWTKTGHWVVDAPRLVKAARPSIVVLAVGTNDQDGEAWRGQYKALVEAVKPDFAVLPRMSGATWITKQIPSVQPPRDLRDGLHPSAVGAAEWRANVNAGCRRFVRLPVRPKAQPGRDA